MSGDGHIQLDWAVETIQLGARARQDHGDLTALKASIAEHGLLQPITVSPDGVLLCGARRLTAVTQLGLRTINVWVRSGVSTRLQRLMAEQDENTLHEPLRPTDAAALYRELKELLAEDAARRKEASQYRAANESVPNPRLEAKNPGIAGPANLAGPADTSAEWSARAQAARLVTGAKSYTTLERVGEIQRIADDPTQPEPVRQAAVDALAGMDQDGKVFGRYQQVQDTRQAHDLELVALAQAALARVTASGATGPRPRNPQPSIEQPRDRVRQYGVRAFLLTWGELAGWTDRYDAESIGPALTDEQWTGFETTVQATVAFLDAARHARTDHAAAR